MNASRDPPVSFLEISRVLDETARLLRNHPAAAIEPEPPPEPVAGTASIRAMLALRRRRRELFPVVPGDPGWSMLLTLYLARLDGRRFHQTRLAVASGVAQTTAIRLTQNFLNMGLCIRRADPNDRRVLIIELSDAGAARMADYLDLGGKIEALL